MPSDHHCSSMSTQSVRYGNASRKNAGGKVYTRLWLNLEASTECNDGTMASVSIATVGTPGSSMCSALYV